MTNEQQNQRVYLCVGNTGTGKSTFVRSMGGAVNPKELVASGGSLTSETTFYPAGPAPSVLLMDTSGFGDSRASDDPSAFSSSKHRANILSAFKYQKLSHFNGVFWFINDPKVTVPGCLNQCSACDAVAIRRISEPTAVEVPVIAWSRHGPEHDPSSMRHVPSSF